MKTNSKVKTVFRFLLSGFLCLGFGLSDRLANAQDAKLNAPATDAELDFSATEFDYQSEPADGAYEGYSPVPAIGSPESDLDFKTYRLSYMQSDRVIALLKALGYATVEFSAEQGELRTENIYSLVQDLESFPLIIKLIDASKTSLFQPAEDGGSGKTAELGDTLGGTYLHQQTSGAPEQRLFILYEKEYPEQLNALLQLLRNDIDVPARQVVIEALVVEVDSNKLNELGTNYALDRKDFTLSMTADQQGLMPFVGKFDNKFENWRGFSLSLIHI